MRTRIEISLTAPEVANALKKAGALPSYVLDKDLVIKPDGTGILVVVDDDHDAF